MKHLLKCKTCDVYTLKGICPKCTEKTDNPMPPKYSPDDKYGKYRRQVKLAQLKKADLI